LEECFRSLNTQKLPGAFDFQPVFPHAEMSRDIAKVAENPVRYRKLINFSFREHKRKSGIFVEMTHIHPTMILAVRGGMENGSNAHPDQR
jgi:hypothetical protein